MKLRVCSVVMSLSLALGGSARAGAITGQVTLDGKGARDAVVYVQGVKAGTPPKKHAVLNQKNQTFIPRVMAVLVGTTVDFPNNDKIFHNVFSFREGRRFDLGMYPPGASKSVTFDKPGLVKIFCNIHSNMVAFVWVLENPYFAVTDAEGKFTINDVPPGKYQLRVWSEGCVEQTQDVVVGAGTTAVKFALKKK